MSELINLYGWNTVIKKVDIISGFLGAGKTTLIKKLLNNTHDNIKLGTNIKIGYIPQEIRFDNDELTVYEHCRSFFVGDESQIRSKLHQFYFDSESIDKKIKNISGGEKVRIKLLELVLKNANFLILDEPTNHIDIDTKEILEDTLLKFEGTILFISHDRYFINKIATNIVRIENKKLISYEGNYDSIKNKQVINTQIKPDKQNINIKGSNRLNEFIKDSLIDEITIGCSGTKVYKIRKKSKTFYLKIADHLSQESIRLNYLQGKLLVPEVVFYEKYNNKSYLLTKSLMGKMLCDDYEIERCIVNLVSNAAKFTPEGGNITITIKDLDDKVMISVLDTGVGIEEKYHKTIFDRFNQVDNDESKGGSGLGLSITSKIVELHKGEIYVESKVGEGSNFVIILPVDPNKE